MKQLLILSGKGGTGKTTIAGTFVEWTRAQGVADCDVDAPNLHLVLQPKSEPDTSDYYGMGKAAIDQEICIKCGLCQRNCAFDAIDFIENAKGDQGMNFVQGYSCEGCGVCSYVCPVKAITLFPNVDGALFLYDNGRIFSTATLKMGSGTSGKLVSEVKKNLLKSAPRDGFSILDGSPGIGCPVIASISGVQMVLIVTEPSVSGISDMKRIVETARKFQTPIAVCINKWDVNEEIGEQIEEFCEKQHIPMVGRIPFDPMVVDAVNRGKTLAREDGPAAQALRKLYLKTMEVFWAQ